MSCVPGRGHRGFDKLRPMETGKQKIFVGWELRMVGAGGGAN